jgi:rhodanese-related sulfurtransferase
METTKAVEVVRTTPEQVMARLARGERIVFLDSRNPKAWAASDVKIPGAIRVEADRVRDHMVDVPRGRTIVAYCTCHEEASSARVAQELMEAGYVDAQALEGGFDAWIGAGGPVEPKRGLPYSSAMNG